MTTPERPADPAETLGGPRKGRGVVVLAWVAIGFGVISLPGVLGFLPGVYESALYELALVSSNLAPFTATLSWLLALIATVISGIRLLRPPRTRNAKRAFALAAPGALLGTVALVAVVIFIGNTLGLFQSNLAARPANAAIDHYQGEGASLICFSEDNGHFVNRYPWYSAFLEAPSRLGTESAARSAMEKAGYPDARLVEVDDYYELPEGTDSFVIESMETRATENEGDAAGSLATITVFTDGPVSLSCSPPGGEYGDDMTPAEGHVIIKVDITLSPTR